MQQFRLTFGFREPYQVLSAHRRAPRVLRSTRAMLTSAVDSQMMQDTQRFKMGLVQSLTNTFHGEIKPSRFLSPQSMTLPWPVWRPWL